jgi:phosphotransferase system  glucose/maltose/N-acetylglucosamine-specific IIC component
MDSSIWQKLHKLSQGLATPVAVLVGLGLLGRWGAALGHSSWWQVAWAVAQCGALLLVVAGVYWTFRRQVRKAQADAALALRALRSPGPLHALLRLGARPSATRRSGSSRGNSRRASTSARPSDSWT